MTPDAPSKIFQSREAIEAEVTDWAAPQDDMPAQGSTDWRKLIDECIDNYLVSNPHLPGDWMAVLEEHGFDRKTIADGQLKVVSRPRNVPVRKRILTMFDEFLKGRSSLDRDTLREYKVGVRRFVDLHGDVDVTEISRVSTYRDPLPSKLCFDGRGVDAQHHA
ncbi:MAG: hypothetical protein ABJL72_14750 [Roseobacter sp.]